MHLHLGAHGSGAGAENGLRALSPSDSPAGVSVKPQPDRLYGRQRSHPLRARQGWLMERVLPLLAFPPAQAATPMAAFAAPVEDIWLEVGFGGCEHARALAGHHPEVGLIACEVFENGICSMLSSIVPDDGTEAIPPLPANLRLWAEDARDLIGA